ncbi:hypothetical protein ACH5RR_015931, partial [Cinchona calisaya]
ELPSFYSHCTKLGYSNIDCIILHPELAQNSKKALKNLVNPVDQGKNPSATGNPSTNSRFGVNLVQMQQWLPKKSLDMEETGIGSSLGLTNSKKLSISVTSNDKSAQMQVHESRIESSHGLLVVEFNSPLEVIEVSPAIDNTALQTSSVAEADSYEAQPYISFVPVCS